MRLVRKLLVAAAISAKEKRMGFSGRERRRLAMEEALSEEEEEEVVAVAAALEVLVMEGAVAAKEVVVVVVEEERRDLEERVGCEALVSPCLRHIGGLRAALGEKKRLIFPA